MISKRSIILLFISSFIGAGFYKVVTKVVGIPGSINWGYFAIVLSGGIVFISLFQYLNYIRINRKLIDYKENKGIRNGYIDLLFSATLRPVVWGILIVLLLFPGFQQMAVGFNHQQLSPQTPIINTPFSINFTEILGIAEENGYDGGVILNQKDRQAQLLLYNRQVDSTDHLQGKWLRVDENNQILFQQAVYLGEELLGYNVDFIHMNASSMDYLVGYRYRVDEQEKKLHSDLLVINKDVSSLGVIILQSYESEYDSKTGKVPQSIIPTIIEFTIDIIGEYLIYQDVDSLWTAQNILTKQVYKSIEDNGSFEEVQLNYMQQGKYIHILNYIQNNKTLVFDTETLDFVVLDLKSKR